MKDSDSDKGRTGVEYRAALSLFASSRRSHLARGALATVLAAALALFSFLTALRSVSPDWRILSLLSFVVFWSGIAVSAVLGALLHVFPPRSERWLAGMLGRRAGRGTLFTSALEFSRPEGRLEAYSRYLMGETVRRATAELQGMRGGRVFADTGRPGWILTGVLIGLVVVVQIVFLGADTSRLMADISDPTVYFRLPRGFNLIVTSGDRFILAGEDVVAEAVKFGSSRGEIVLKTSSIPGVWRSVSLDADTVFTDRVPVAVYRHTFAEVREDLSYYFEAGGERTDEREVRVAHRPVVNRLSAVLSYPQYTGAEPETLSALAGRLVALSGTRVELTGETSKEISKGALSFVRGGIVALSPVPGGFRSEFKVLSSDTFKVEVIDSMGLESESSVSYPVVSLEDRQPFIEIVLPEDGALLPRSLTVDLLFRAADDYGISRILLRFMREGKEEGFRSLEMHVPRERIIREMEGRFTWSLGGEGILPGDRVVYYLEIYDNNTASGPGHARTAVRRLMAPSMADVYADLREREAAQSRNMQDVLERGREINERLRKLSDDLKSEGGMDWSRRSEGREILEEQEKLRERVRQAADQLDLTLNDLERNRVTSQEIGEKMEEIQKLLRQIENEDLRKAIEDLARMLEEMPLKDRLTAMDKVEMEAEDLIARLERTIELLKQVVKEEKMEELLKRMEEMLEQQRKLRESTESGDLGELSQRQEDLGEEYESFESDLEDFAGEEGDSTLASELEETLGRMKEDDLSEMMMKAAGEMRGGERAQAGCTQDNVIDRMLSLFTCLGRCQMSMSMALQKEVIERIERAAVELVEVSKLEEELAPRFISKVGAGWRESALEEQVVLRNATRVIAEDLYRIARATMAVPGGVFLHLGAALGGMDATLEAVEGKRYGTASQAAARSCQDLNMAVIEMLKSMSSSGGSSGSSSEMMQRMMGMQLSIDQQLRRMLEMGRAGEWSVEERAKMARLAAEQRAMEELVKQIVEESAGANELLGRIDDLADEMKEIANRLESGELDRSLMEREERILSRMLQSQRSLQRRDYMRERVSTTAGDIEALRPVRIEGLPDKREVLLEMIRRAMQEKGPAEYEELIRLYFRSLSRKVRE